MERTPLNYAQPTHPAEEATRHIPHYEAGRPKGIPNALVWLILFLFAVGYFVILPAVLEVVAKPRGMGDPPMIPWDKTTGGSPVPRSETTSRVAPLDLVPPL